MKPSELNLEEIARNSVREALKKTGMLHEKKDNAQKPTLLETSVTVTKNIITKRKELIKEALVVIPKTYQLRTDWISQKTKEAHEEIYKKYVNEFNKVSAELDTAPRDQISELHSLKLRETNDLDSIKLHELYFSNIADQNSEIHRNSIPYMRLSRDWGTFETWQLDFRGVALAANDGWAVLYYEPYRNKYMNAMITGHSNNVPLCGIPILVLDMHEHAYFKDYLNDKKSYINSTMREIQWSTLEARMVIAERANLKDLYLIQPLVNSEPQKMIDIAANVPPIRPDQVVPGGIKVVAPASEAELSPKPMLTQTSSGEFNYENK